ncbi:MAG: glycoside hydrolase family 3 N-terminal domain-containing protein, partial [Myxococcota bacterium]
PHDPIVLAVDQEGGRVQRVRAPATEWPPMRVVGRAGELAGPVGRAIGRELRALGFNLNFAPCADVDTNPANPVIGDRSFGDDPAAVARDVAAFVTAHQAEHVVACAKHFPGHGDTAVDTHLGLPVVERPEPELRRTELPPFAAAVRAGVGAVMVGHVVYPTWDEDWPASLSPRIVPRWLRKELRFDGVAFTDDLEMKAVCGRYAVEQQVQQVTRAQIDVLLVSDTATLQHDVFRALVLAQEDDPGHERLAIDAVRRVDALRETFFLGVPPPPPLGVVGSVEHRAIAERARARGG